MTHFMAHITQPYDSQISISIFSDPLKGQKQKVFYPSPYLGTSSESSLGKDLLFIVVDR